MPDKPKIAFYWCASCGGCEESIVDLAEGILDVVAAVDIVFWPVAMDFKVKDVEALPDGSIAASLVNGAIRTSEQEQMARMLRRKSKCVIAYGSCAMSGGVPALANQFSREQVMKFVYEDAPSVDNPTCARPLQKTSEDGRTAELPEFRNVVRALDQVVDVDYYIPGCAPHPKLLVAAVQALLSGDLPPRGTVLAPDVALCEECPRKDSKPKELSFTEFKRPHMAKMDPSLCLLAQGFACLGPATRGGCGAACMSANMPCTGCSGPTSRVHDHGAKMLSSLCANLTAEKEDEIDRALDGIPDPVGTFYRYGLAHCTLRRKVNLS